MGDGKVLAGSVKAKVMIVKPDRFKMKALEKENMRLKKILAELEEAGEEAGICRNPEFH